MENIRYELDRFWNWASMTAIDYSRNKPGGEWETNYPYWDLIYEGVKIEIEKIKGKKDSYPLDDILEAMAIDNECEIVMELIEDNLEISNMIVEKGHTFYQPETRWQIAELLKRIGGEYARNILIKMITKDKDKYVRKRALLSLNEVSKEDAKKYASKLLDDNDDDLKTICSRILKEE